MAKRANDLLDVFRGASSQGSSTPRRARKKQGGRSSSKRRGGPEGVFLAPRQVLLVSSAMVLLLVLAFTVGLGVGRGGFGSGTAALQKKAAPTFYWIRGSIPSRDVVGGRPVDRDALLVELGKELGLQRRNLAAVPADGDLLHVYVGWWTTQAEAQAYLRLKHLDSLRLKWGAPFHFAEIVEGARPR